MEINRGVSLIILVITIIITIVMATVIINVALGNEGIIERVTNAIEQHELSSIQEKIMMEYNEENLKGKGIVDVISLKNRIEE